ncbi:unnamed protein product [Lactuca saligna]|uniref:Uncharacterized protein n=1 Tax=Lactuca saligna TaxID=75948 RepID=A0AA35ZE86_LACSI|nr:unnamed protein product [Lactuca saligna]
MNKLEPKSKKDTQVFENMEEFLSSIKESISKIDLPNQSTVLQESLYQLISNVESNIKSELAPILELVLHLPTNVPHAVQVSEGGEKGIRGVGSSKDSEKGVVVGKVSSTQISISLPMPLRTTSTTTTTTTTTRDLTKGISINAGARGSSSSSITNKSTSNDDSINKGKAISIFLLEEEKKKQQALEIEKQNQINNIWRRRENDSSSLNKGDHNKQWCYETTKDIVSIGLNDYFQKVPIKNYNIENFEFNQLDF